MKLFNCFFFSRITSNIGFFVMFMLGVMPLRADSLFLDKVNKNKPVDVFASYTGELWSNMGGGLTRGVRWDGLLDFGFSFDTQALGFWDGGSFYVDWHWYQGNIQSSPLTGFDGVDFYLNAGLNWFAPFPERSDDTFGFAFT